MWPKERFYTYASWQELFLNFLSLSLIHHSKHFHVFYY